MPATAQQKRSTRSGREYGQVAVASIDSPQSFRLSALLESVLAVDPSTTATAGNGVDENLPEACSTTPPPGPSKLKVPTDKGAGAAVPRDSAREALCLEEASETKEVLNSNGKRGRKHRYRLAQKAKRFEAHQHLPDPPTLHKHLNAAINYVSTAEVQSLPFSSCGYQGHGLRASKPAGARGSQSLAALLEQGYQVIEYIPGCSQPIVDPHTQKVFAVVGTPNDPTYAEAAQKAFHALDETRKGLKFTPKEKNTSRGNHSFVNYGISHGQGSTMPHWLQCRHEDTIRKLLADKHLIRLAKFANYAFAMWAPKTYSYYVNTLEKLAEKIPDLKWRFWESAWACTTFNFGPRVCCAPHRDALNLAFGWCCIIALGNFDYKLGGHLVLHDLKLVVEFPTGAVILIPSALLLHGNTSIQPGEARMSFTQYCAAGLFCFVENGFICEEDLKVVDPERYEERQAAKEGRKELGLGFWSTVEELLKKVL